MEKQNNSSNEHSRNIPQLRFKEFDGDWEEKMLGNIGEYIGGGTPDTSVKEYWQGHIPWISSSDISDGSIHKIDKTRFITEKAIEESATKLISKGSVLMVSRVGIGKFAIADEDLCTSQDFTSLISEENEYFLGYYFSTKANRFVSLSQGTSIKGFTTKDIKSAKFSIPTQTEQTKIANFLTAVDKRINLLQKKKAELEQYKKGVMQQLFSVEKLHATSLRFKQDDGTNFPDWEEKMLGEVFNSLKGQGISKNKITENGEKECILYGELYTTYSEVVNHIKSKTDTEEGTVSEKGDLLVPCSTTTTNIDLANVTALNRKGVLLGGDITILRTVEEIDSIFFAYYLSNYKKYELAKFGQGTTIVHLYYNHFKVMNIEKPCFKEQQKIATFLSTIDKSIEKMTNQIDDSVIFKKGLLQKMFV